MSQENVEIAVQAWQAAVRRPKPDFTTVNALYDPAHEFVSLMNPMEGGRVLRGAQGYREYLTEMGEALESWEARLEEATAIDEERVLLIWSGTLRGKRSGAPASQRGAAMLTVRNGKVTRTENYSSRDQALEAANLKE